MASRDVSFLVFFLIWARLQKWKVPELHVRICTWLDTCGDRVRVLMVFRGAAKSTIYAVWKAYRLYKNRANRSLIYAADDKLATKLTRDTINVLRRHPLCAGMLPSKPGAQSFWVNGSTDARNPSMEAVGINSNATGSRADDADFDDIEVPKNIKTPEARETIRTKIEESTHILVPGWQKTFVGTPHTHDSIYTEQIEGGAAVLKIPLFEHSIRYGPEKTAKQTRFRFNFPIAEDGLYVMCGIGKHAKLLVEGTDYLLAGNEVVFAKSPGGTMDIYAGCAWPERFTREEIELKRKETKTLNGWDSQYQLHAKPVKDIRLDPDGMTPYDVEPVLHVANGEAALILGSVRLVGVAARWDPAGGKINSDVSAFAIVFQDAVGRRYLHRAVELTGQVSETSEDGRKIIGGQVAQICDLIKEFHLSRVTIETNGIGGFAGAHLKAALKQRKLICGVAEEQAVENKNKRILEAMEPPLSSAGQLWAHMSVFDGPLYDQMKDWNPATQNQADDYLDVSAGAIADTPERIGKLVGNPTIQPRDDWHPAAGEVEVEVEYD